MLGEFGLELRLGTPLLEGGGDFFRHRTVIDVSVLAFGSKDPKGRSRGRESAQTALGSPESRNRALELAHQRAARCTQTKSVALLLPHRPFLPAEKKCAD